MACQILKNEFSLKKIGFSCNDQEKKSFYVSQWGQNRVIFFIYRLLIGLLSLSWTVSFYIYCSINCPRQVAHNYRYITLWSDFLRTTYFLLSAILSFVGLINNKKGFVEQDSVKWLRGTVWYLHTISVVSNIAVTALFWSFVASTIEPEDAYGIFSILLHAGNCVLIFVDLFVAAIPARILHAVYGVALALFYGTFTILLWRVGDTPAVYEILNWEENPGLASAVIILSAFVGSPVIQALIFAMYLLKQNISRKIVKQPSTDERNSMIQIKCEQDLWEEKV